MGRCPVSGAEQDETGARSMTRRWLVTGCSTGLGRALAGAAAEAGDRVLATARRVETLDGLVRDHPGRVLALPLDVRDPEQCEQAVATMLKRFGGVDVLVNNAGNGVFGTVEEVGDHELRDQLETLVVGPRGPSSNPVVRPKGGPCGVGVRASQDGGGSHCGGGTSRPKAGGHWRPTTTRRGACPGVARQAGV